MTAVHGTSVDITTQDGTADQDPTPPPEQIDRLDALLRRAL
jgi:hypothetical protein